jgi:N-acetylglucosamine-6-phosphate deacetylase
VRTKKRGGVVLITDGMPLAGMTDSEAEWEGQAIRVEGGKAVRSSDGTIIGGVITLDQTVRNAREHIWGWWKDETFALRTAVRSASTHAARAMHLDGHAAIEQGALADLVLHDAHFNVQQVWIAGECVTT